MANRVTRSDKVSNVNSIAGVSFLADPRFILEVPPDAENSRDHKPADRFDNNGQ